MKVAIVGASGYVGGEITREAITRGHEVTAIARNIDGFEPQPGLHGVSADIYDVNRLTEALGGNDVAIHAFSPGRGRTDPDIFDTFVAGHKAIINAAKSAGVKRLLCVGGAASLKTKDDIPLIDSPEWPEAFNAYKDSVLATRELYYILQKTEGLDWVFLAPSSILMPGPRTGAYRTGRHHLLYAEDGESKISTSDYAVAMIDELEKPSYHCTRFTVGY